MNRQKARNGSKCSLHCGRDRVEKTKQDAMVPGKEHSKPILLNGEQAWPVDLGVGKGRLCTALVGGLDLVYVHVEAVGHVRQWRVEEYDRTRVLF